MDTRKKILVALLMGIAVAVLIGFVLVHERGLFPSVDIAALFAALVFLLLFGVLITDVGVQLEMRLPRQFRTLGSGYGLVQALKAMTAKVDAVRARRSAGQLTEAEAATEEARLFEAFSRYFTDRRWKQVHQLKQRGFPDDAKKLAHSIRKEHEL